MLQEITQKKIADYKQPLCDLVKKYQSKKKNRLYSKETKRRRTRKFKKK